jgi:uncharacterized peroxidase-related enzyme
MTDKIVPQLGHTVPVVFTRDMLDWLPWLEPMEPEKMTERHLTSLVDASRIKSPYFRLLARDPDVLEARTRTDKDIFYNPEAGLPRAERELAAAATSRLNGCIYCASVHARFAATYSRAPAPTSTSAGTRSWRPRWHSPRRRSFSDPGMSTTCATAASTTRRSST